MPFIANNVADSLIYIYILEFILNSNGIWHCYHFSASQPKNGNVADAARPASAPIADAGKTAPAPGAGAVAVFLGAGCRLLPMPRFGTVSGNGTRHRWKRANPTGEAAAGHLCSLLFYLLSLSKKFQKK